MLPGALKCLVSPEAARGKEGSRLELTECSPAAPGMLELFASGLGREKFLLSQVVFFTEALGNDHHGWSCTHGTGTRTSTSRESWNFKGIIQQTIDMPPYWIEGEKPVVSALLLQLVPMTLFDITDQLTQRPGQWSLDRGVPTTPFPTTNHKKYVWGLQVQGQCTMGTHWVPGLIISGDFYREGSI